MTPKREYGLALLAGGAGAAVILLAAREQWAQALFTQPKPLPAQTVGVSGNDLTPVVSALALAALAGLAAVIATRGTGRRIAGALLALFGAGAGTAALSSASAASVLSVAASKVASPAGAVLSGTAGSATSGNSGGSGLVLSTAGGQAVLTGAQWHVLVLVGALLVFAVGLATALRGPGWPVMSSRYDAPSADGQDVARGGAHAAAADRALDSATMWESLNGGADPTDDHEGDAAADAAANLRETTPM